MADIKIYGTLKNVTNEPIANAEQIGNLSTVATSGSYNDLDNKPTIPTNTSELNNDSGFLTEHQDISGKADKNQANIFTQKNTFPDITLYEEYALDFSECNIGDQLITQYGTDLTFKSNNFRNSVQLGSGEKVFRIEFGYIIGPSNCIEISVPENGILSFTGRTITYPNYWKDKYSVFVVENNGIIIWTADLTDNNTDARFDVVKFMRGTIPLNVKAGIIKIYFSKLKDDATIKDYNWDISNILFSSTIPSVKQTVNNKADKVSNPTNGNFAALDSNGNLTDSGHKHSDYQPTLVSGTNIKTINNNSIVGSGNLSVGTVTGITMNGSSKGTSGVVNLGTVVTSTTSSVTSGSTTPITSGGVYTALQSYEKKMSFTSVLNLPTTCVINTYYRITSSITSLAITLPSSSLTAGDTIGISFTTGSSITTPTISNGTIYKQDGWSDFFEANATYEIVALYDGGKWLVTSTKFKS